jgi:hypothetical protein
MSLLRVDIITDYGDTVLVRCPTPIPTGTRNGSIPSQPLIVVSKADLAEESQKRHGPRSDNSEARVRSVSRVKATQRSEREHSTRSINDKP